MKPYKNPYKFNWICPLPECGEKKHSGGLGHIQSQIYAHLKNKHGLYEEPKRELELRGYRLAKEAFKCTA